MPFHEPHTQEYNYYEHFQCAVTQKDESEVWISK